MKRIAMIMLVLVVGCTTKSTAEKASDYSADACIHFRNVAGDYSAGLLTFSELRDRFKEVRAKSDIATPGVQAGATALVAAATALDLDALLAAVKAMDNACKSTGH